MMGGVDMVVLGCLGGEKQRRRGKGAVRRYSKWGKREEMT
jgi:hypothetical protein